VWFRNTRFARRVARESDGLNGFVPRVVLADSDNPGLSSSTPLVSSIRSFARDKFAIENYEWKDSRDLLAVADYGRLFGVTFNPGHKSWLAFHIIEGEANVSLFD